jgi:sulfotransferase
MISQQLHFISGLPRSGSTLLAALLRQNPRFHAAMTSPVGSLVNGLLEVMSGENESAVFLSDEQKQQLILSLFSTYYQSQSDKDVIFDTNRLWCSKLPLIHELFPEAKVICCVRNIAWVMDSIELLIRRNVFELSKLFNNRGERSTVYSRTEALSGGGRLVGFAYNALREAFYSQHSDCLLLVDYDLLVQEPKQILTLIYQFLGKSISTTISTMWTTLNPNLTVIYAPRDCIASDVKWSSLPERLFYRRIYSSSLINGLFGQIRPIVALM